jgi:hypothetical protein
VATQATDAGVRAVAVAVGLDAVPAGPDVVPVEPGVVPAGPDVVPAAVAVVPRVRAGRAGTAGTVPAGAEAQGAAAAMDAVADLATVTPVAREVLTGVPVAGRVAPARAVVRAGRVQGVTGRRTAATAAGRTAPTGAQDGTLIVARGANSGAAPAAMPALPDVTVNPAGDADRPGGL